MLKEKGTVYRYREYTEDPLSLSEIRTVLKKLGLEARQVLRKNDATSRELGLTGEEPESVLIQKMAEYPTLLQRPIGVLGERAVVGRPAEKLLDLIG